MSVRRPPSPFAHLPLLLLLAAPVLPTARPAAAQDVSRDGPAISPFRGMRPQGGGLEVQVDGDTWFALESLNGIATATLLRESHRLCGPNWWKRLTEDLPALLEAMGHDVPPAADLELRDLGTGRVFARRGVPMTHANRRRLWEANQHLRVATAPAVAQRELAAADAHADLAELRALLDERWSYRGLRDVDLDALVVSALRRLGSGTVALPDLCAEVERILLACGDGHSRVGPGQVAPAEAFLPFLVQRTEGGHAAFRADRGGLLDPLRPFVVAIDGEPLERWLLAARARTAKGSPAMRDRQAERGLRELAPLRSALGLAPADRVAVTLRGSGEPRTLELGLARAKPLYGEWPRSRSRLLGGDVGYLRIEAMDDAPAFLDGIDEAMQAFRTTRGLIVDVRGNGGGSRDALRRLFPYLLGAGEGPQVVNVARVLLDPEGGQGEGLLEDRGMHPTGWDGWTDAQRAAVAGFAAGFRPAWTPPRGERFSAPHYLVLDRSDNARAFPYEGPVVVLMDGGCFSATDVFLAALQTRPQVRLCGTASSGGSGRARPHRLRNSGIRLQLSSMVSYRPDGRLFEGNGVEPDAVCLPEPGDLVTGGGDAVLQAGLALLGDRGGEGR